MRTKLDELYKLGMDAFEKKDYVSAERCFLELLIVSPRFADVQNKIGIIFNQTNRLELAAQAFEKALAVNPGYTEASLNLAITYSDLGMYEKAREVFERAAHFTEKTTDKTTDKTTGVSGIDPFVKGKLADEHLRLGNMYYELSLLDDAIEEYRKALRLSPNFADIITQLGIALRDKGHHDEAIKEFTRAKESNPHYIPARLHLGITYYSQGFLGLAEEEWREALVVDSSNSAIKTYLNFVKPQNS
jgi:tetratricopeptide (TPR) repeat protein